MASAGTFLGTSKLCLVRLTSRYRHSDAAANTEKAFCLPTVLSSCLRAVTSEQVRDRATFAPPPEAQRTHRAAHRGWQPALSYREWSPAGPQGASLTWSTLSSWTPNLPPKPRTESTCEQCLERLAWYSWPTADCTGQTDSQAPAAVQGLQGVPSTPPA